MFCVAGYVLYVEITTDAQKVAKMAERGLVHPSSHFPVAPPYVITTQHRQGLTWVHARVRVVLCTTVDSRDAPKHLALLPTIQTEI